MRRFWVWLKDDGPAILFGVLLMCLVVVGYGYVIKASTPSVKPTCVFGPNEAIVCFQQSGRVHCAVRPRPE